MRASPFRGTPATDVRRELHRSGRTPAARFVLERRHYIAENPLHDSPRRLDTILAGKEHRISVYCVAEQPLVWRHLVAGGTMRDLEFGRFRDEFLPWPLHPRADRDLYLGTQAEAHVIRLAVGEHHHRRSLERDDHFGRRRRELLAGADEERHTLPAPRVDMQPHRRERLDRGVPGDILLGAIPAELPAHDTIGRQRPDLSEDPHLLVADPFLIVQVGGLHCEESHHLQHVVLHHIANGAGLFVEPPPSLETEPFRHRDLHALDVMAVPHRLEERVREPEQQEILYRLLAEIMVDAEDALLIEYLMQRRVERPCTREVAPEWLFHHDARVACAPRGAEPLSDGLKHGGRNSEVMQGALRITQRRSQRGTGVRAVVVALDVL